MPRPDDDAQRAPRFRSSREAYDWILWDPGFDPGEFVIGYDDHAEVAGEIALESFEPGGEIPWHRVWYIRRGEDVVWDREERIDRLASIRRDPTEPRPRAARRRLRAAPSRSSFLCPHCAEAVETWPDPGGGPHQAYVEDCPVCCRPNRIDAVWSNEDGEYVVEVSPDE